jgi:hypothetical protein
MSSNLFDDFPTVWSLTSLWYLPTCMISSYLYNFCLPVGRLLYCMMSAYLCNCSLSVWCLFYRKMSVYLYEVFLPLWYLSTSTMSAQLNDACSTVWCLLNCLIAAFLYDICSTGRYLPAFMISSHLSCLLYWSISIYMSAVFLSVWCLPTSRMSA